MSLINFKVMSVHWTEWLNISNVAVLFSAYLTINFGYQIIYYRFFHPLKDFPGPFWPSVTRLPVAWHNYWCTEIRFEENAVARYGPIFRISPTMLFVSTASSLPSIYHRTARKTPHYTLFSFGKEPSIFQMHEHADYVDRAKTISNIYTSRAHMPSTEETIDRNTDFWIHTLRERFVSKDLGFDLGKWVALLTMDSAIETSFGRENSLKFVQHGRDVQGIQKGLKDPLPTFGFMCRMHPFISWLNTTWFGRVFEWFMLNWDPQMGRPIRFTDRILRKRLASAYDNDGEKKTDMLQSFIDARTPQGNQLSLATLRGELLITILAGTESTAAGICTTLHQLMRYPSSLKKVLDEFEIGFKTGHLSRTPKYSEILSYCPYYVACVRESLRFYPSLSSIIPRYSTSDPSAPLILHGRTIPPNTEVCCNAYITHRDQTMFGDDADEWNPDRWLDPEKARVLEKYNFSFGYGSRPCLGKPLGLMGVMKVVCIFLTNYEMNLADPMKLPKLTARADFGFWENFQVKLATRSLK
ncbi:hypothetical protein VTL71DRAFT_9389 [Oculimacula yallundae]|uniref:Cytochrome P450 n=1 Tax=Oculimacula yallundae TaxID=86028 RepID=A0ABR4BSW4_9HELO